MSDEHDDGLKTRREALKLAGAGLGLLLLPIGPLRAEGEKPPSSAHQPYWGYAIDTTKCIGCCACIGARLGCRRRSRSSMRRTSKVRSAS